MLPQLSHENEKNPALLFHYTGWFVCLGGILKGFI